MKYKILKPFRDKVNGRKYEVGEIITFTKKRANEILKVDLLIEKVKEDNEE